MRHTPTRRTSRNPIEATTLAVETPTGKASLTATLITRNEASRIGACLASIASLADEIVVVDTGSTDETREMARGFGACVSDFAWCDDFSAARNAAIEQATCDWLLYIDADERARPCDRARIRADLADPHLLAATVYFTPRTGFTAYPEHRLLRRDPRIRFHGAMHETFLGDLDRLVAAGEGTIGSSRLALDHIGYDGDQSHKLDRNLRLLLKQIAVDPVRPYLRWHLGAVYRDLGRAADAEAEWTTGANLPEGTPAGRVARTMCALELAKLQLTRGEDPSEMLTVAATLDPDNWMLRWLRGKARLAAGDFSAAQPIFESLAAVDGDCLLHPMAYDRRMFGGWALAELAEAAFRDARYADSAFWFGRAAALAPSEPAFRAKRLLAEARA